MSLETVWHTSNVFIQHCFVADHTNDLVFGEWLLSAAAAGLSST